LEVWEEEEEEVEWTRTETSETTGGVIAAATAETAAEDTTERPRSLPTTSIMSLEESLSNLQSLNRFIHSKEGLLILIFSLHGLNNAIFLVLPFPAQLKFEFSSLPVTK
jgi:hypothetical protein